jgi:phosphoglycerate dehydrogenase-like enzyme
LNEPLTVLVGIYSPFAAWNIPEVHVARLGREFTRHTFLHATADDRALALIPGADVAFMPELRPAHLAAATRLRWVHSPAAGIGGMLFPAMVDSSVVLSNSRGISADTIAEHVLAVTLVMFRKLTVAFRAQEARQWAQDAMLAPPRLRTIEGSRVLVVGLGSIGTATARRMAALGAHVTGVRRNLSAPIPGGVEAVAAPRQLRDLLPNADVVVLAAPQTHETRLLIGAAELALMRRGALLVNVSRGKLVDEVALVEALTAPADSRTVEAAALDVFDHEPLSPDSPLWSLPNVLITPHISGFRADHWDAVTDLFADNLRRFESGQPLRNVVNKEAGY